jgi:PAS domain-containing protein
MKSNWKEQRNQIIGLGENSFKKSYYPELQLKISEIEAAYTNFQSIFNTINDGIVIHDEQGNIYC